MREETFINYKSYLWLWIMLAVTLMLSVWYYLDNPVGGRSGSSTFGYASGAIATAAILYLMWFGIRKRSYYAHRVSLKGWLAAHIWLGVALVIIVPLHAAFDFGFNLHTLAYVFMCLVVLSGIVGTIFYRFLPAETISNRGGGALKKRLEDLNTQGEEIGKLIIDKSPQFIELVKALDIAFEPSLLNVFCGQKVRELDQKLAVNKLALVPDAERSEAIKVISLISKKRGLAASIQNEIVVRSKLKIWLYAHIPLSVGLVVLVAIHILSVFYFY